MHLGRGICYIINDDTVVGEREIESLSLFIFLLWKIERCFFSNQWTEGNKN